MPMKNINIMKICYVILTLLFVLVACDGNRSDSPIGLFSDEINTIEEEYPVIDDSIISIDRLQSNNSYLVFIGGHPEKNFSLFSISSGEYICQFGTFGQGPGEILRGTEGYLSLDNKFTAFDFAGRIFSYNIDSVVNDRNTTPVPLLRYQIEDVDLFSQVIPVNDSLFFGAGSYKETYQYVLFDKSSNIIDYGVNIFNAFNNRFNASHKSLSNQGILIKHPVKKIFAYIVFYSSNLDIIEVQENHINVVKMLRLRNPTGQPTPTDRYYSVDLDVSSPMGYIDIAPGTDYIYALYTDKKWIDNYGKGNQRNSDIILVFDWEGNPVKKYKLNREVYCITVNESLNKLFASCINSESGWTITAFDLGK